MTSAARPVDTVPSDTVPPSTVPPEDAPPGAIPPADLNALDPAIWPRAAGRAGGVLTIGGIDVRDLASEFGTPLFACDESDFRARCREFRASFDDRDAVCYAAKAFCCREVLRWAAAEGLGVDVCTAGELETALSAGLPGSILTLHGNNKTVAELALAVDSGVGHIVLDSFEEIARLAYLAEQREIRPKVLVRVTTGVDALTHEYIATAHDDQKFGFSLASGAAAEAVRRVVASPDLELAGLRRRRADQAPADRRARPGHRRPGHGDAVRGRHDQGRAVRRRLAHVRERGRRDERQHPHRPVRRQVYLRARLPRVHRARDPVPRGRQALRERRHRRAGRLPAL
jgi:Pyridoxal-dependent decarboxylase, pyridoxal binding domain